MGNKNRIQNFSSAVKQIEQSGVKFGVKMNGSIFDQLIQRKPDLTVEELMVYAAAHFNCQPKELVGLISIKYFK